jgi:hypothetical protein
MMLGVPGYPQLCAVLSARGVLHAACVGVTMCHNTALINYRIRLNPCPIKGMIPL